MNEFFYCWVPEFCFHSLFTYVSVGVRSNEKKIAPLCLAHSGIHRPSRAPEQIWIDIQPEFLAQVVSVVYLRTVLRLKVV